MLLFYYWKCIIYIVGRCISPVYITCTYIIVVYVPLPGDSTGTELKKINTQNQIFQK